MTKTVISISMKQQLQISSLRIPHAPMSSYSFEPPWPRLFLWVLPFVEKHPLQVVSLGTSLVAIAKPVVKLRKNRIPFFEKAWRACYCSKRSSVYSWPKHFAYDECWSDVSIVHAFAVLWSQPLSKSCVFNFDRSIQGEWFNTSPRLEISQRNSTRKGIPNTSLTLALIVLSQNFAYSAEDRFVAGKAFYEFVRAHRMA